MGRSAFNESSLGQLTVRNTKQRLQNLPAVTGNNPYSLLRGDDSISRRSVLVGALSALAATVARPRGACAVSMIVPPSWLREAHAIIRGIQAPRIPNRVVSVEPIVGDARPLIQSHIDEISRQGGGRVVLQAGPWRLDGPIRLRSRVELHLDHGAALVFSGDRRHYLPVVHTRWEGTELYGYSPCIYAYRVHDVAVTGLGTCTVDPNGDMKNWRREQANAQKRLRSMGATGVPLAQRVFAEDSFLRPSFMQFFGCERVLVEGVSIGSIPFWGVHVVHSVHCTVRGISVNSDKVNNDGVDVDSSRKVVVENCSFNTGDDCIAIKSGRDLDGRSIGGVSEDIVIRDCRMRYSKSSGVAIGSEMSGGVRGVFILRCEMGKVDTAITIKANFDRGGFVERIRGWNLRIRECGNVLHVTTAYHGYMGGNFPPRFEDIVVEDVRCAKADRAIVVRGSRESLVQGIALQGFHVEEAGTASAIVHATNVSCKDVVIAGKTLRSECMEPPRG